MIWIYIIAVIVIIIDQATKLIVMHTMDLEDSIRVIKDFFYITYIKNDGVAFGYNFSENPVINLVIQFLIAAVCLTLFVFLSTKIKSFKGNKWYSISLGLLIGGLIGNVIDRIFYDTHSVTDFLSFILYYPWFQDGKLVIMSYPFAVFNFADSCLNVGVFMMVIYLIFMEPKRAKAIHEEESEKEDEVIDLGKK